MWTPTFFHDVYNYTLVTSGFLGIVPSLPSMFLMVVVARSAEWLIATKRMRVLPLRKLFQVLSHGGMGAFLLLLCFHVPAIWCVVALVSDRIFEMLMNVRDCMGQLVHSPLQDLR